MDVVLVAKIIDHGLYACFMECMNIIHSNEINFIDLNFSLTSMTNLINMYFYVFKSSDTDSQHKLLCENVNNKLTYYNMHIIPYLYYSQNNIRSEFILDIVLIRKSLGDFLQQINMFNLNNFMKM